MDPRLRARLDASDVVQDAFLDAARDLDAYLADPKLPPLLWLRLHVGRRLTTLHRQHLGTRMRDAGLEISLYHGALPEASSAALASMLLGRQTSPTQAAQRAERMLRVQEALNSLDAIDREVLALAALRTARPRRGGAGARDQPGGRGQAVLPRPEAAQGPAGRRCPATGRASDDVRPHPIPATTAGSTSWPRNSPSAIAAASGRASQEYADRLPELADEIREMFPALVEVEQVEGDARDDVAQPHPAVPLLERGRRLPGPPRDRPGRHGRGLRGRAGLAGPPRGPEGPARPRRGRPQGAGAVPPRGQGRGAAAPHQHRAGLRGRAATATSPSTPCSSSRARGSTRSSTSCGGSATRSRVRPGRARPRPARASARPDARHPGRGRAGPRSREARPGGRIAPDRPAR